MEDLALPDAAPAALPALAPLASPMPAPAAGGQTGGRSGQTPSVAYRQREPTQYRGVTRTSGTNTGLEKFDVQ